MDQRSAPGPEQFQRPAPNPKSREDKSRKASAPEPLMAILKRASGPDEREQQLAPQLAMASPPPRAAAAPASAPARAPDGRGEDPVDAAGLALIALLQSAAEASNSDYDRATIHAGRLANELRATEDRIRQFEAEAAHFRERAARAEEWLQRIAREVESQ